MKLPEPYQKLLAEEVVNFISEHSSKDVREVMLSLPQHLKPVSLEIGNQIKSLQKAKQKLPLYYSTPKIIFPPALSVEQSSSVATALYKSGLVNGEVLVDITGGMGVDSLYFSKKVNKVIYIEQDETLAAIAKHNFEQLDADNIEVRNTTAEEFLREAEDKNWCFDWIYADPARRDEQKRKVFLLKDCQPNFPFLIKSYEHLAKSWMLKAAPLLDIQAVFSEVNLKSRTQTYVVAHKNECKELLFVWNMEKENADNQIYAINLHDNKNKIKDELVFSLEEERTIQLDFSEKTDVLRYIYEPNAAVLKAGAFKKIANYYGVQKLHPHTHLYTSKNFIENFVGRKFEVLEQMTFSKKEVKRKFGKKDFLIITRNFPISVKELRKQFQIRDAGEEFLIFTSLYPKEHIILRTKII